MYFSSSEIPFLPFQWLNETNLFYVKYLLSTIIIAPEFTMHGCMQKPLTISLFFWPQNNPVFITWQHNM